MPRALFVGGLLDGRVLEVPDPAPEEWDAGVLSAAARLSLPESVTRHQRLEGSYRRRDLEVQLGEPPAPQRFVVYLAGPEVVAMAMPGLQQHLVDHVVRKLAAAGMMT